MEKGKICTNNWELIDWNLVWHDLIKPITILAITFAIGFILGKL